MFAVETVKSLILALACVDRHLIVEEGVRLATLETNFQVNVFAVLLEIDFIIILKYSDSTMGPRRMGSRRRFI